MLKYCIIIFFITARAYGTQYTQSDISKFLGWSRSPDNKTLCGGCYIDSVSITATKNPRPMQDMPMNITSDKSALFAQHGASVITGNVALTQPGREITTDQATFFRDSKTGKITSGIFVGHVNFREYGKLIVADRGDLNFVSDTHTLDNSFYRLLSGTPSGLTNIWGKAKRAVRDAAGVLRMKHATYNSCPPDATSWHLWSNSLTLDRNTGRGEAFNAFFFIRKVPVFYIPYYSFPIDKRRKSGFLPPSFEYSKTSGYDYLFPYYFNLAPNYDATFMPEYFSKRGILLGGLFRYLTPINSGSINASYIPHDRVFTAFRDSYLSYPSGHARSVLQNSSSNRGLINLQNDSRLNENWSGSIAGNYTTDDYYLQDFGSTSTTINEDQLFNQAKINYTNERLGFSGLFQEFQTLHRINPSTGASIASDQYKKLPQLALSYNFYDGWGGLDYQVNSEATNFAHRDNFDLYTPIVAGGRFDVNPALSLPLNLSGINITPKIQLEATGYSIHNQAAPVSHNIVRVLSLTSIDSKAVLSRDINFFHDSYTQTLEPRLFYLFIPKKDQSDIPIFDTSLPAFDFAQQFRTNRFSGIDRIGDANQITTAITTRFLDSGQEKLNASLGQTFNLHKHQVIMTNSTSGSDPLTTENFSPLTGQAQCYIIPKINSSASATWDYKHKLFNTADINLQYNDNAERVVNFLYSYRKQGDISNSNLRRINTSIGWKLYRHWNALGSLDYDISFKRAQNYTYGLEYDSCCWALRLMQSRTYVDAGDILYTRRTYLQIFLKGLGDPNGYNYGFGDRDSHLPTTINGYNSSRTIGI